MLEHHLAIRVYGEADIEEAVGEGFVARLGLGHDEQLPLAGEVAQKPRLGAGDIDCHVAGVCHVVEVEYLIGEALESALGHGDEFVRANQDWRSRRRLRSNEQCGQGCVQSPPDDVRRERLGSGQRPYRVAAWVRSRRSLYLIRLTDGSCRLSITRGAC